MVPQRMDNYDDFQAGKGAKGCRHAMKMSKNVPKKSVVVMSMEQWIKSEMSTPSASTSPWPMMWDDFHGCGPQKA